MSEANDLELVLDRDHILVEPSRMFEKISPIDEADEAAKHAGEIRKIVNYLLENSYTTNTKICALTQVSSNNLSQFLSRNTAKTRCSPISLQLYKLVIQLDPDFLSENREVFNLWENIIASRRILNDDHTIFFKRLLLYMDASQNRINRSCLTFNGTFYVYRHSIVSGRIVKTKFMIRQAVSTEKMWVFEHEYKDSMGGIRTTYGTLLAQMGNIYCIGKIGSGFGMEVIVFGEPMQEHPKLTQALTLSIDTKNQPICARAVLRYCSADCSEDFGTFDKSDGTIADEIAPFEEWIKNTSSIDKALTLKLL